MKKIMVILAGPIFDPDASLKARFEIISDNYSGVVITNSSNTEEKKYGNFYVIFSFFRSKNKILTIFSHLFLCIKTLYKEKKNGAPFDLVVCYDPLKTGLMALLVSKLSGARLVVEVNGVYQSDREYVDLPPIQAKIKRILYTLIESFVLRRAHGVKLLFPDQLQGLNLRANRPIIRSYFNYVDMDRFYPAPSKNYALFVGYPFYRKGVDVLLDAFLSVSSHCPDWELKIIGWFSEAELEVVKSAQLRCDRIQYLRPVKHSEMPGLISQCAFLVLPSRSEAMGRVLIEAMACGKPRVGSRIDGIPQYIKHMDDGMLFDVGSAQDLSEKLSLIMSNQELRERMGGAALARYKNEFSKSNYLKYTTELYDSVINR